MGRKAKQEKTDFTVIVEDQYGNILTDEYLSHLGTWEKKNVDERVFAVL